jgi:hypothetical protein
MDAGAATLLIYLAGMGLPSWELDQLHRTDDSKMIAPK